MICATGKLPNICDGLCAIVNCVHSRWASCEFQFIINFTDEIAALENHNLCHLGEYNKYGQRARANRSIGFVQ